MNDKDIFIHIGLHKTGTTFLQHVVFPNMENINYLGAMTKFNINNLPELFHSDKNILISNEALSGNGYLSQSTPWIKQFEYNMKAINTAYPEAKIIIGFREHSDLIKSFYAQYLHEGGTETFDKFIELNYDSLLGQNGASYVKRIEIIKSMFKHEPLIYIQERLKSDFQRVIKNLEYFTKGKFVKGKKTKITSRANKSVGDFQSKILIRLNRISYSKFNQNSKINLNNKVLKALRITPRILCQKWLSYFFHQRIKIESELIKDIQAQYNDDWNEILRIETENSSNI